MFSFEIQRSFRKQISKEFRESLEIVDTHKMFANVFVYGQLRGLVANLVNFYGPEKIPKEFSKEALAKAINYTRLKFVIH